jgi:hypothetical protein
MRSYGGKAIPFASARFFGAVPTAPRISRVTVPPARLVPGAAGGSGFARSHGTSTGIG